MTKHKNSSLPSAVSRRDFLKTGAAASSLMILPSWVIGQGASPNSKLNIAVIGAGGRGRAAIRGINKGGENIVAFCDVDEKQAAKAFKNHPDVPRFKDYRVMFDKMGKEIDAVTVSTPDHMHYAIALWALANGKHVFCEKPLVRTVAEARALKKAAKEAGVITQMGNQGHADDGIRTIQEWVQAGILGDIQQVYHWTDRPWWPQGEVERGSDDVPATLDYNLWLGVAPKKPYWKKVLPFNWRGFRDYGCASIGDMACHIMDASFTGLSLGMPKRVESQGSAFTSESFPRESTIHYTYARPGHEDVKVTWMDGGRRPSDVPFVDDEFIDGVEGDDAKKGTKNGTFIVGSKGTLYTDTYCGQPRLFPREYYVELRQNDAMPEKTLPRVQGGHFQEWFDGIKANEQPGGNFDYAAEFIEAALLGLVSLVAKESVEYDAKNMKITNSAEADKLLHSHYEYRKEFLPG